MMESELDFLKATVLSKSKDDVTLYSDMPMTEMAKDPDFPKKWMYGMALMLKKGLHLNTYVFDGADIPLLPQKNAERRIQSFFACIGCRGAFG